jgi:hypothetical protein
MLRDGRLTVDGVDLGDLSAELEGRAVWLLSHGALSRSLAACDGPRTVSVGRVEPPVVLGMFAQAGFWARCQTPGELQAALSAGFPPERLVASGRVKDDGFIKDALLFPVGALETTDDADAANIARMATFLECELPPNSGQPEGVAACALQGCGGLFAPVLIGSPQIAVDASWSRWAQGSELDACARVHVWPLQPGPKQAGTFEGLTTVASAPPCEASIHGTLIRGDWALVPSDLAFGRLLEDLSRPKPETVMTRDGVWRILEERPLLG